MRLSPFGIPQVLIVGTKDNPWRVTITKSFAQTATEKGDNVRLMIPEGANHFDVVHARARLSNNIIGSEIAVGYANRGPAIVRAQLALLRRSISSGVCCSLAKGDGVFTPVPSITKLTGAGARIATFADRLSAASPVAWTPPCHGSAGW